MDQYQSMMTLLAPLRLYAEAAAPTLSSAVENGFLPALSDLPTSVEQRGFLTEELQRWFVSLFTSHALSSDPDCHNSILRHPQKYGHLPLGFILGNLEIILRLGYAVAVQVPQRDLVYQAFIISLSCELVKYQRGTEQRLQELSELMLLD